VGLVAPFVARSRTPVDTGLQEPACSTGLLCTTARLGPGGDWWAIHEAPAGGASWRLETRHALSTTARTDSFGLRAVMATCHAAGIPCSRVGWRPVLHAAGSPLDRSRGRSTQMLRRGRSSLVTAWRGRGLGVRPSHGHRHADETAGSSTIAGGLDSSGCGHCRPPSEARGPVAACIRR